MTEPTHTPLPCPLCCGKAASYFDRSCDCCGQPSGVVHCLNCGCEINHRTTEAEALTAWNTRAVNSHHDLIEALRAVKAELQAAWEARTLPAECVSGETIRKINAALTKAEAGHG